MRVILLTFTNIEYTIELAEGLTKLVDVVLIMPERQVERFQNKIDPKVRLHPICLPRLRSPKNLIYIFKIIREINRLKPDVVHIQRGHPWFNFALPLLKGYCLITTIHDVSLHTGDRESAKIPPFTHKIAIKHADQIIVHGEKLKNEMIVKYNINSEIINVVRRGINSIYRRYIDQPTEEENHFILFFGRIWKYKGLRYLIEAEPFISDEIPNVKIIIAGRGENFRKYEEMMINRNQFVVYNERISDAMVAELFQKASVVVLPYTDASQSGIVPLAYAFKKPVVITDVGSLPEVVDHGETGYIVPPRNAKKLAEAIIDLMKNKEKRNQMGEKAYQKAKKELSWDQIAIKTVEIYEKGIYIKNSKKLKN